MKWLEMDGNWLGHIQPMRSKPRNLWQGFFFLFCTAPSHKKDIFKCWYEKTFPFIVNKKIKRALGETPTRSYDSPSQGSDHP